MKVIQIGGFLGSGKTTLLIEVARQVTGRGLKTAAVVNDIGEVSVDARVVGDLGLQVKELANGCICCQIAGDLANTFSLLRQSYNPDVVLVEPTGVAVPSLLKRAIEYSEEELEFAQEPSHVLRTRPAGEYTEEVLGGTIQNSLGDIDHAPVAVVLDASRIDLLLKAVRRVLEIQLREADIIAINKVDIAEGSDLQRAREFAREVNDQAEIVEIAASAGIGTERLAESLLARSSARYAEIISRAEQERKGMK